MAARRIVVDGSNIATEGRTLPSLRQLNEAVLAFLTEYPDAEVTVVVDATFGHRIDPTELQEFEEAEANNELVSPPAGAIGRGDAFLLRIAGKIGATVLSNDSFQEFHGEHEWLFDEARLIGGKPVPGIGWIFTPRTPVRGIKSRKAVKDAKRKGKPVEEVVPTISGEVLGPRPVPKAPPPWRRESAAVASGRKDAQVAEAIATATEESVAGGDGQGRKRRRKKRLGRPAEPVNDALAFITFIAEHPLGSEVSGEVETFTSHGAFVLAGGARCYVPISALGEPPPRAARDVLNRGERRTFVVQALDPQRRGIELALPEFAKVAGAPLPETIEAEISEAPVDHVAVPAGRSGGEPAGARAGSRAARGASAPATAAASGSAPAASGGRKRAAGRAPVGATPAGDGSPSRAEPVGRAAGAPDHGAEATDASPGAASPTPAKRTRKRAGAVGAVPVAAADTGAGAPAVATVAPAAPVEPAAVAGEVAGAGEASRTPGDGAPTPAGAKAAKRTRKASTAGATEAPAPAARSTRSRRPAAPADGAASDEPVVAGPEAATPSGPPDSGGRARTPRRNPAKSASQPAPTPPPRTPAAARVASDSGRDQDATEQAVIRPAAEAPAREAAPSTRSAAPAAGAAAGAPRTSGRRTKSAAVEPTASPVPAAATPGVSASPRVVSSKVSKAGGTTRPAKPAKTSEVDRPSKPARAPKAAKTADAVVKPAKADKPPKAKASKSAKRPPKG